MYSYKASKDGTLSNPYRYVKQGETVESDVPLTASWLVSPESPEPAPLPITPMMNFAGRELKNILVPPVGQSDGYQENMKTLIAKENAADGTTTAKVENNGDGESGTGNTDVL